MLTVCTRHYSPCLQHDSLAHDCARHYLSDILVGSTLGYVTGTYVAEH
jgi:hypothetical protein